MFLVVVQSNICSHKRLSKQSILFYTSVIFKSHFCNVLHRGRASIYIIFSLLCKLSIRIRCANSQHRNCYKSRSTSIGKDRAEPCISTSILQANVLQSSTHTGAEEVQRIYIFEVQVKFCTLSTDWLLMLIKWTYL